MSLVAFSSMSLFMFFKATSSSFMVNFVDAVELDTDEPCPLLLLLLVLVKK